MLRVAGRLLLIGFVIVVGVLLTVGTVGVLLLLVAGLSRLLFPGGLGPDDGIVRLFVGGAR